MAQAEIMEVPPYACEIGVSAVSAARASVRQGEVEMVRSHTLPAGAVAPSLQSANLVQPEVVREAIAEVMEAVAGGGRELAVVVPDAAARVMLLDFDSLPAKRDEAEPLIRMRLKKLLPFEIEDAVLSYQLQPGGPGMSVLAVIMLRTVRDEYEELFRKAGCQPGVLIPSTLAALGMIDGGPATFFLKLDVATTSVAVTREGRLLLFRTHEGGYSLPEEEIAADAYPSLVYLQDTYGVRPERIVLCGASADSRLAELLREQSGARVEELGGGDGSEEMRAEAAGCVGVLLG